MADKILGKSDVQSGNNPFRYKDMGDGTFAEVVALASTPTIDIGKVDQGTPGASPWPTSDATAQAALASLHTDLTAATPAGENHVGQVGGHIQVIGPASALTVRSAITYAIGQIIAQSATAGSCSGLAIPVARGNDKTGMVRRIRLKSTDIANLAGKTSCVETRGANTPYLFPFQTCRSTPEAGYCIGQAARQRRPRVSSRSYASYGV